MFTQDRLIRIAIVARDPLYRIGIVGLFETATEFEVVGTGSTAHEAIQLAIRLAPNVILLDKEMSGSGLEAAAEIVKTCPTVGVVVLLPRNDETSISHCLTAGAHAYVVKQISGIELLRVARAVCEGHGHLEAELAKKLLDESRNVLLRHSRPSSKLTRSEYAVFELMSRGCSNREIASKIAITESTVKSYVQRIFTKIGARNRVEAVLHANQLKASQ